MFRKHWDKIESDLRSSFSEIREDLVETFHQKTSQVRSDVFSKNPHLESEEDFLKWGRDYVENLKTRVGSERMESVKDNFFVLLRNLGINDQVLRDAFISNKKEILDPLIGESIAVLSLVLGWSQKDKDAFSQALGEIGVIGVFAAKPFICLIAICGLAYGYHRSFHKEAFKKGGVLGLAGIATAWLAPAGVVGLLAAIVVMVYFNKKLSTDRPVETQLKEMVQKIKGGGFFSEIRQSWNEFEEFLEKVFENKESKAGPQTT